MLKFNSIYGVGTFISGGFLTYTTIKKPEIYSKHLVDYTGREFLTVIGSTMFVTGPLTIYKKKPNFANGSWILVAIVLFGPGRF